jgi:hypothetical protein
MTGVSLDSTQSRHTRRLLGIVSNFLALLHEMLMPSMRVSYLAELYSLFGLNPLGYNVVITLMLATSAVCRTR